MEASIKGFFEKIKGGLGEVLGSRELFPALLIIAVGTASFGLGRLSMVSEVPPVERYTVSAAAVAEPVPVASEGYVASKNSNRYHLPTCTGAQRIAEENRVWFATREEAEAAGYLPAGNCEGL